MTERVPASLAGPPVSAEVRPRLRTNTWPMWAIALLPLLGLLTGVVGFGLPVSAHGVGELGLRVTFDVVPFVLGLLLAAADRRVLLRRGVVAPLHWGWAVLIPVSVIGRSVVVRRRVHGSLAPLWVWLVSSLVVLTVNLLRG